MESAGGRLGVNLRASPKQKGQECTALNWGGEVKEEQDCLDLQAANSWTSSADCALSPFAAVAPQVHGDHAGEGAELAQVPDTPGTAQLSLLLGC